jgi:hypothetical protein
MATYFHRFSDPVDVGRKENCILRGGNRSSARRQSLDPKPVDSMSDKRCPGSHSDSWSTREQNLLHRDGIMIVVN